MASPFYLIVDKGRENAVTQFLDDVFQHTEFRYVEHQINTGDYLVCRANERGTSVLACVERKSLADFAASLRDGRYDNKRKMLALRDKTGCQLIYVVEGNAFPSLNATYGRKGSAVKYSAILAAMDHLRARDGVHIVLTQNVGHTAERLLDLVRAYAAVFAKGGAPAPSTLAGDALASAGGAPDVAGPGDAVPGADPGGASEPDDAGAPDDASAGPDPGAASPAGDLPVPEFVTGRVERPLQAVVATAWSKLRGVSIAQGGVLSKTYSIAEFAALADPAAALREVRNPNGNRLGKNARDSLLKLARGDPDTAAAVVAGIPNIGGAMAAALVASLGGVAAIACAPADAVAGVSVQQSSRCVRVGDKRTERIQGILNWKCP